MPRRYLLPLLLVLLGLVLLPVLVAPEIPPLDLSNHLGRAYILAHLRDTPGLAALYDVVLTPTPNLAADLLLSPLVLALGPRPAVRLFAGLSLIALGLAFAALSRAARGRWDLAALLGIPLAHNLHFNYGFINYYWGVAAALFGFSVWLRLGDRAGPLPMLCMVILSLLTYLFHLVGFGALMVALFAASLLAWDRTVRDGVRRAGMLLLVALAPALLYLAYSRGAVGGSALHRAISFTAPLEKVLGLLRVLRASRPAYDLPLLGLIGVLLGLGLRGVRSLPEGQRRTLGAGGALLVLWLLLPGALDLETSNIDLRVALPALLFVVAALVAVPERPLHHGAVVVLLLATTAWRGAGATLAWQQAAEGITQSRALCAVLPESARVLTLHNEVPQTGRVEHQAGERHGWAYCLFARPLFFPALFHVPGSQPLRLRLSAYEGKDTLAHYHVKNGFANPEIAGEIPWPVLLKLSDFLWLTGWDLQEADPRGLVSRRCVEEVGRQPRIVVYRIRREEPGCL